MKLLILLIVSWAINGGKVFGRKRTTKLTNGGGNTAAVVVAPPSNYQSYIFATQWAGSSCALKRCLHTPPKNIFNIHGLWPTNGNTSPQNCAPFNFNENSISQSFRPTLYRFWNGYHGTNWGFIKYELSKHATCWQRLIPTSSRPNRRISLILNVQGGTGPFSKYNAFLHAAVELSKILNIYQTLQQAGILPDANRRYSIASILNAMNTKIGLNRGVIPVCQSRPFQNETLLLELRFCLDLGYNFVNCYASTVQRGINFCGNTGVKLIPIS